MFLNSQESQIKLITKFIDLQRIKRCIQILEEKKTVLMNKVNIGLVHVFLDQSEPHELAKYVTV